MADAADARRRAEKALVFMDAALRDDMPPLPSQVRGLADAVRALLASEPTKAPFVSRNEEWGLRPDFTTAGVTAPPAGAEVREAAEELQRIDNLLARRITLDGLTRVQKIALALRVCEETDPKGEVAARYVCRVKGGRSGGK